MMVNSQFHRLQAKKIEPREKSRKSAKHTTEQKRVLDGNHFGGEVAIGKGFCLAKKKRGDSSTAPAHKVLLMVRY